ncbi:MAG: S1C family serine protease [Verrucomicrobiota bacterium]
MGEPGHGALLRRTLIITGQVADSRSNYTDFAPSEGYIEHFFIAGINPVLTSGGVWVNKSGEIVGVQSGRLKGDMGAPSSGLSMAAPPKAIRLLASRKKNANTPGLGGWIWESWTVDQDLLSQIPDDKTGLVVTWVKPDGPLAKVGVNRLDVLVSCEGNRLFRRHSFLDQLRAKPVGSTFTLSVYTPKSRRTRAVTIQTQSLESNWLGSR